MTIVDVLQTIWLSKFVLISPSTVCLPLAGLVDACLIPLSSTSSTNLTSTDSLALMSLSSSSLCNWTQAPYSLSSPPTSTHLEPTCSFNLPHSQVLVHLVLSAPPPAHIQMYETGSGGRCGGGRLPPRPLYQHLSGNRKAIVTRRELIAHYYVKIATSPFIQHVTLYNVLS